MAGLTKRYGRVSAVENVSLNVMPGEVVGLLGPNGAGKTTTLRVLAGLLQPTQGRALIRGIDVTTHPLEARKHLGFLTSTTGLYERLTPRELWQTFGTFYGMTASEIAARVEALAEQLDLRGVLDRRCGALSSGQKQRVSIARALVHDPAVLVLDEPTATLDPLASAAVLESVRAGRAAGKAVLFSTHRMDEAEYLCDRLYFMRSGTVVAEGSAEALRQHSGERTLAGAFLFYARGGSPAAPSSPQRRTP